SRGPSNGLARQIIAGAPAEIFVSANRQWCDALAGQGLVKERVDLLGNRLTLIAPRGNPAKIVSWSDLRTPRLQRLALAGENVPAGAYARQALEHYNLYALLQAEGRIARAHDVRGALTYVERREAEAGIVYSTDARASQSVEIVAEFASTGAADIVYPAALIASNAENAAGQQLFEFLQGPEARAIFRKHGFIAPAAARPSEEG
ncbi:MAG: molybdate ABC transporter substrate-binding protein, partial [Planctomycetales bacterium]|nr:molybdate ABC transporter substrate-binding protein [Planctomycetales bacterium]